MKGVDEGFVLAVAAALEKGSEHPIAPAILKGAGRARRAEARGSRASAPITGQGVAGDVGGKPALIGNAALFASEGVAVERRRSARCLDAQAASGTHRDPRRRTTASVIGIVTVADPIKPGAREAIAALRAERASR